MRRSVVLNQSGVATAVIALIFLLLNAAVLIVMNSATLRGALSKQVRDSTYQKKAQHIVDTAEAIVVSNCNALVLGASGAPRTVSSQELRSIGMDLTRNFVDLYRGAGFDVPDGMVDFKGFVVDAPDRMPTSSDSEGLLTGLAAKIRAGTGYREASREFLIHLVVTYQDSSTYKIMSCESSEELERCYSNSNTLHTEVPLILTENSVPHNIDPATNFDTEGVYARLDCFGKTLRTKSACNAGRNSLASALRVCLAIGQQVSQFVPGVHPPFVGIAESSCRGIANLPDIRTSCGTWGGS